MKASTRRKLKEVGAFWLMTTLAVGLIAAAVGVIIGTFELFGSVGGGVLLAVLLFIGFSALVYSDA